MSSNVGKLLADALVECKYAESAYPDKDIWWIRYGGYHEPVLNSYQKVARHPYENAQYNALRNFTRMMRMRSVHARRTQE